MKPWKIKRGGFLDFFKATFFTQHIIGILFGASYLTNRIPIMCWVKKVPLKKSKKVPFVSFMVSWISRTLNLSEVELDPGDLVEKLYV